MGPAARCLTGADPALGSFRDGAKVTQDTEGKQVPLPEDTMLRTHVPCFCS